MAGTQKKPAQLVQNGAEGQLPGLNPEMASTLKNIITKVGEAFNQHQPVLNSLKKMNVQTRMRTIDGEPCIVIPVQELMMKEYMYMSGVDINAFEVGE